MRQHRTVRIYALFFSIFQGAILSMLYGKWRMWGVDDLPVTGHTLDIQHDAFITGCLLWPVFTVFAGFFAYAYVHRFYPKPAPMGLKAKAHKEVDRLPMGPVGKWLLKTDVA